MKFAPAAVTNFLLANRNFWKVDLYTLTLLNASVFRWTTADFNITTGGNTWLADGTILKRGGLRQSITLEVDAIEIDLAGAALMSGIPLSRQVANGLLDDARVQVDSLVGAVPGDLSLGVVPGWFEGRVAGANPTETRVTIGVRSDLEILMQQKLPKFTYSAACAHAVYDPNCTLSKAAFTLAGAASGVPTVTTIPTASVALTAKAAAYFNLGVLVFTSGALTGVRRSVSDWSSNTFTVSMPLPSVPLVGNTFTVYPGCKRTKTECGPGKFNNLVNFRGFPHIPSTQGGA